MIPLQSTRQFAEMVLTHLMGAVGGSMIGFAAASQSISIWGAAVAGSAFMAAVGMLLSESIPLMKVKGLEGNKRLLANWLFGLSSGFIGPFVQRRYYPDDDVVIVTGMLACLLALLGLVAIAVGLPRFIGWFQSRIPQTPPSKRGKSDGTE